MDTNKKNTYIIILSYVIITFVAFIVCPIWEIFAINPPPKVNYLEQLLDGFLFHVLFWIFIIFFKPDIYEFLYFNNYSSYYLNNWKNLLGLALCFILYLFGSIYFIYKIYKNKKLFPYILILNILYCIYIYFGLIFFMIRYSD